MNPNSRAYYDAWKRVRNAIARAFDQNTYVGADGKPHPIMAEAFLTEAEALERGRIVKWRWWYPEGAIRAEDGGWDKHTLDLNVASYDAAVIAEEIVQKHVEEHGTDGSNSFEIEIAEPTWAAGVFDVALEWDPVNRATRRNTTA